MDLPAAVPTGNPKRLPSTRESVNSQPDGRSGVVCAIAGTFRPRGSGGHRQRGGEPARQLAEREWFDGDIMSLGNDGCFV